MNNLDDAIKEMNKHTKEDLHRYIRARKEAIAELQPYDLDKNFIRRAAQRDLLKFSEILNNIINEDLKEKEEVESYEADN